MSQSINTGQLNNLNIAYPTLILTILAFSFYVFSFIYCVEGQLSIAWAIGINSLLAYILFTSMHEAAHMNISGKKYSLRHIDEIIGWLSGIPLFAPFYTFKIIHFRHHAFTNDPEKDPDHWLASKNFFSLLYHSTTIFPVYMIKAFQLLKNDKSLVKNLRKELKIGFIALFGMLMLVIIFSNIIGWKLTLLLWILPAIIAQVFLAITFDWLPHHPHEEKSRYLNTRTFDIPGLSFLLLGQNYHLIHHLYPRIPFYKYKETYFKLRSNLVREGAEIISFGNDKPVRQNEKKDID